jgi:hypothetical protein
VLPWLLGAVPRVTLVLIGFLLVVGSTVIERIHGRPRFDDRQTDVRRVS